jgi:GMP reductase
MVANMDSTGTFEVCAVVAARGVITCLHKYYSPAQILEFAAAHKAAAPFIAISAGTNPEDFAVVSTVFEAQCDLPEHEQINFICLDVANGYSEGFVETVRRYRASFPKATLIAGNVVTGEMTEELILSGADIVKIGIGPGSVCTTRIQTGVGYPQLSAVIECSDAAHGLGGMVISDGGCTCPGDFAKAFGGGADFVMSGGMFSGHDESGGELITRPQGMFKVFYGMSSTTAMDKHSGGVAEYRSSEGKTVEVPYRGPVAATVQDILGGLRSACTYVGASSIKEMSKRTTFIRCTQQVNPVFNAHNVPTRVPESASSSSSNEEPKAKKGRTG